MKILENKIPPPIIAILFATAMWLSASLSPSFFLATLLHILLVGVPMLTGLFFCAAGILSFKKASTTVNPLKPETASSLVTTGIFQITRNPMYLGVSFILLAWALYLSSALPFLGVLGFIFYINRFQIVPEERALIKIFEPEFVLYQSQVRRWL